MKDKVARGFIEELAERIGCVIVDDGGEVSIEPARDLDHVRRSLIESAALHARCDGLAQKITALEEVAKPICSKCGQRIQNGLKQGDVEKVSAAVRKADKK